MFTFKIQFPNNSTLYEFVPVNYTEIKLNKEMRDIPCIGYNITIKDEIVINDRVLDNANIKDKFFQNVTNNIHSITTIYIYEGAILVFTGEFTAKNIKFDVDEKIYKITIQSKSKYKILDDNSSEVVDLYDKLYQRLDIYDTLTSPIFLQPIKGAMKLNDVIMYFIRYYFQGYNFISTFLLNEVNPVSNIANDTNTLYIAPTSNVIYATESTGYDSAWHMRIKFMDILINLQIMYDLRWYIDEANMNFVIEHVSQINSNFAIELDLTDSYYQKYTNQKNKYGYDSTSLPKNVEYKNLGNQYHVFDDRRCVYENISDVTTSYSLTWYTDLVGLSIDKTQYSQDSIFLIKCVNNTQPLQIKITEVFINEPIKLTFDYAPTNIGAYTTDDRANYFYTDNNFLQEEGIIPTYNDNYYISRAIAVDIGDKIDLKGKYEITAYEEQMQIIKEYYESFGGEIVLKDLFGLQIYLTDGIVDDVNIQELISEILEFPTGSVPYVLNNFNITLTSNKFTANARIVVRLKIGIAYTDVNGITYAIIPDRFIFNTDIFINTSYDALNYELSFIYLLQSDYHKYSKYGDKYLIDDKYRVDTYSQAKIKTTEVVLQVDSINDVKENSYIRTFLGDLGEIQSSVYDSLTKQYTMTIAHDIERRFSDKNFILNVEYAGRKQLIINNNSNTIYIEADLSTDLTNIAATITISKFAQISPSPSSVTNFESSVTFTVTAENGETRKYRIITYKSLFEYKSYSENYGDSQILIKQSDTNLLRLTDLTGFEFVKNGSNLEQTFVYENSQISRVGLYTAQPEDITYLEITGVMSKILDFSNFANIEDIRLTPTNNEYWGADYMLQIVTIPEGCKKFIAYYVNLSQLNIGISSELNQISIYYYTPPTPLVIDNILKSLIDNILDLSTLDLYVNTRYTVGSGNGTYPLNRVIKYEIILAGTGYSIGDTIEIPSDYPNGITTILTVNSVGLSGEVLSLYITQIGTHDGVGYYINAGTGLRVYVYNSLIWLEINCNSLQYYW
jgi:hypothetical protein